MLKPTFQVAPNLVLLLIETKPHCKQLPHFVLVFISVSIAPHKIYKKHATKEMAFSSISAISFDLPFAAHPPPHLTRYLPLLPAQISATLVFQQSSIAVRRQNLRNMAMALGARTDAVGIPRSVPVRVALELLQAGHRYLDVRTVEEFSAGHAAGAVNIPYMFKFGSGMAKNLKFLEEVSSYFGKDDEIIVGCQSGKRSLMAATDLLSAGYTGITDIAGGYSAWVQSGLPSE